MFLKQNEVEINADNISILNLLKNVAEITNKDLLAELIKAGKLISGTIILLNGRNIYHLEKMDTIVSNGDKIDIFPPGGGG
ncbi:MAG: MoaD/ThiS family protein [Candidatus Cloacimonetes bacterium]|nr:MoaD/ThiS family protein [Candidatus Cloacimonadota bacterium]